MSKVSADLVKSVLLSQDVDVLSAEDLQTGARLYYATGAGAALCEAVDQCEQMMVTPYRVRAWSSKTDRKRGGRPIDQKPFEWVLPGRYGWPAGTVHAAPAAPEPTSRGTALVNGAPTLDKAELLDYARAQAERDQLRTEVEALRAQVAAMLDDDDDDDDDDEPVHGARTWWDTPAAGEMVKELSGSLGAFLRAKAATLNGRGPGAPAAPPAPAAAEGDPINADELRLIQAFRNLQQVNPDEAQMYGAMLVEQYGPKPKEPAANGTHKS